MIQPADSDLFLPPLSFSLWATGFQRGEVLKQADCFQCCSHSEEDRVCRNISECLHLNKNFFKIICWAPVISLFEHCYSFIHTIVIPGCRVIHCFMPVSNNTLSIVSVAFQRCTFPCLFCHHVFRKYVKYTVYVCCVCIYYMIICSWRCTGKYTASRAAPIWIFLFLFIVIPTWAGQNINIGRPVYGYERERL